MVKFFEKISGLRRAGSWVVVPELAWGEGALGDFIFNY